MPAEVARLEGLDADGRIAWRRTADCARADDARGLSSRRNDAAGPLGRAVTAILRDLGFPAAAFLVDVDPAPSTQRRADAVTFLLAPNPGEPPRPLASIASGGELSRVSLAIKGARRR